MMRKFILLNNGGYGFSSRVRFPVMVNGVIKMDGTLYVPGSELLSIGAKYFIDGVDYRFSKDSYKQRLTMKNK